MLRDSFTHLMLTSVFCKSILDQKVTGGPRNEVGTLSLVDYPKDLRKFIN